MNVIYATVLFNAVVNSPFLNDVDAFCLLHIVVNTWIILHSSMLVCLLVSQQSVAENRRSELRAGIQALLKDGNSSEPVKRPHVRPARGRSVCQSTKRGVLISRRLPVSFLLIIYH